MPVVRRHKRDPKRRNGHPFTMGWYKDDDGKMQPQYGPTVPVIRPEHGVELDLMVVDVEGSHRRKGEGDTRNCAVSFTIRRQADRFAPYAVNGVVEFMDSRAFVGIGRPGHYPTQALRFEHSCAWVTKLFDRRGWKKLIAMIEEAGGVITIALRPFRLRLSESSPGKQASPKDGSRSRVHAPRGAMTRSMRLDARSIQRVARETA